MSKVPEGVTTSIGGANGKFSHYIFNACANTGGLESARPEFSFLRQAFSDGELVAATQEGKGTVDDFVTDINTMYKLSQLDPTTKKGLESETDEKKVLAAIKSQPGFSEMTNMFLGSIFDEGAASSIGEIAEGVELLAAEYNKEVLCEVTTASQLNDKQKTQLLTAIRPHVDTKAKIILNEAVEEDLIGGFKLRLGEKYIDLSVKKTLEKLNTMAKAE